MIWYELCAPQLIETVSAVDKDEMAHRQHFHFSLAPEVTNNHNFSLKDNRGMWHKKPLQDHDHCKTALENKPVENTK